MKCAARDHEADHAIEKSPLGTCYEEDRPHCKKCCVWSAFRFSLPEHKSWTWQVIRLKRKVRPSNA